jgi:hypothetical protein
VRLRGVAATHAAYLPRGFVLCGAVVLVLNFVYFTAVVNRDVAWSHLSAMSSFGPGNSRANSLYWTATRAASLPGFNATSTRPAQVQGPTACSANSACDAIGTLCCSHNTSGACSH